MARKKKSISSAQFLAGTREEVDAALRDKTRDQIVDLVFSLVTFERLVTASQLAKQSQVPKSEVLRDMKEGRFSDPIFGPGFFQRSKTGSSYKVTTSAANEWRRSFFVPAVPAIKKKGAQNGDGGKSARQMRRSDVAIDLAGNVIDTPIGGASLTGNEEVHLASRQRGSRPGASRPQIDGPGRPGAGGVDRPKAGGGRATGQDPQKILTNG